MENSLVALLVALRCFLPFAVFLLITECAAKENRVGGKEECFISFRFEAGA